MKILLLEDNLNLVEIIKEMLEEKNYIVDCFQDGNEVLDHLVDGYDCFVLDINVPNIDGLTILKNIREYCHDDIPVIIISSNIELETIKTAYKKGCNDFLKKPFYIYELEAKINLLCKKDEVYKLKEGFIFNINEQSLYNDKKEEIPLTHKEKLLITLLLKNPDKATSLESIEEYVWEGEITTLMSIRSLIKRIRIKLPENSIETKSFGYTFHLAK